MSVKIQTLYYPRPRYIAQSEKSDHEKKHKCLRKFGEGGIGFLRSTFCSFYKYSHDNHSSPRPVPQLLPAPREELFPSPLSPKSALFSLNQSFSLFTPKISEPAVGRPGAKDSWWAVDDCWLGNYSKTPVRRHQL